MFLADYGPAYLLAKLNDPGGTAKDFLFKRPDMEKEVIASFLAGRGLRNCRWGWLLGYLEHGVLFRVVAYGRERCKSPVQILPTKAVLIFPQEKLYNMYITGVLPEYYNAVMFEGWGLEQGKVLLQCETKELSRRERRHRSQ
jgi:hypothetical protein